VNRKKKIKIICHCEPPAAYGARQNKSNIKREPWKNRPRLEALQSPHYFILFSLSPPREKVRVRGI